MMSRIYDVSMMSLGVACLKKRLGGSAFAATLARRMTRGSSAASLKAFSDESSRLAFDAIMRRVFGRQGSEVIAHSARKEIGRLIFQRPVCMYMKSLQVVMRLRCSFACAYNAVSILQAEARWRLDCDRSSFEAETTARTGSFSADAFKARICTAAEDLHVDVVELCSIAEPAAVLAKDRYCPTVVLLTPRRSCSFHRRCLYDDACVSAWCSLHRALCCSWGCSALFYMAREGFEATARLLLVIGSDANAKSR